MNRLKDTYRLKLGLLMAALCLFGAQLSSGYNGCALPVVIGQHGYVTGSRGASTEPGGKKEGLINHHNRNRVSMDRRFDFPTDGGLAASPFYAVLLGEGSVIGRRSLPEGVSSHTSGTITLRGPPAPIPSFC